MMITADSRLLKVDKKVFERHIHTSNKKQLQKQIHNTNEEQLQKQIHNTNNELKCKIDGCEQKHHAKGLCMKHYDENRRTIKRRNIEKDSNTLVITQASPQKKIKQEFCKILGCIQKHHAKGLCMQHYNQSRQPK
jgi:hypothetical protein